ncbi:MAG: glycoside hydrolase family 3 C-terminal domain-containing protein [Clostridia bacterium]|nr:glycoside hydrolase family 3 C-terminal domain-containing protein [Clostridia bacterium]
MKKRIMYRMIACALLFTMLCTAMLSCSKKNEETQEEPEEEITEPEAEAPVVEGEPEEEIDPMHPANRRVVYSDLVPLSRGAAAEGMVLLKNEEQTLPLNHDKNVALFGNAVINLVDGASGSANVNNSNKVNLLEGMLTKQKEEKITVNEQMAKAYAEAENYVPTVEEMTEARKTSDVAVYTITRTASDGADRDDVVGDYYLSTEEMQDIKNLIAAGFDDIIVVLNVGCIIDTTRLLSYPEIKAILLAWLPGEYGGDAVADILVGDVTPSGKLTDTLARNYKVYPSYRTFAANNDYVEYKEDIYVGYRYFETFDPTYKDVNFEFGFGLSYTTFEYSNVTCDFEGDILTVKCKITNTGDYWGKETVQLYVSTPQGLLGNPAKELCAFAKTRALYPGDSQTVTMTVDINDLASYDDMGKIQKSAYVLEEGDYEFFIGSSIRDAGSSGLGFMFTQDETVIVKQLSEKLPARMLKERLLADGSYEKVYTEYEIKELTAQSDWKTVEAPEEVVMFEDLEENPELMASFLAQLEPLKLIRLLYSHTAKITGGEGTTEYDFTYGIPYANTADGTAGLRLSRVCTEYPIQTALACTWNTKLLEKIGEAVAEEAKEKDVQMWLAPAVNIHRDPLCGANFEYFSEDPYLSGVLAAAMITGSQEAGVATALKHLVGNEKETNRIKSDSRMSERALREIYLEPFRIAIELADPWMLMTSYNKINGVKTSASYDLLNGIVRDEWGYTGVICTDRKDSTTLPDAILAGVDLTLPHADRNTALQAYNDGILTRALLEEHAARVIELVLKTGRRIKGAVDINSSGASVLKSTDFMTKSADIIVEDCEDEGIDRNTGANHKDLYLEYYVNSKKNMEYDVTVRVASPEGLGAFDVYIDGTKQASFDNSTQTAGWQVWADDPNTFKLTVPAGNHTLKIVFTESGLNFSKLTFTPAVSEN